MATYYWVGGSGNWNATSTTNWSNASGGSSGFGPPTSADDVIFDAGSNTGTNPFTVTVTGTSGAPARCLSFTTGGAGGALDGAMTLSMGATAFMECYGSMTLPATNLTWTGVSGATLTFKGATAGKTVTTNGVTFTAMVIAFDGVGSSWTLGSAFTNTTNGLAVLGGTLNSGNYNITTPQLAFTGTSVRSISLGSSTLTCAASTPINISGSNLTFNAGTSTLTCSSASATLTFNGNGVVFYNAAFTATAASTTVAINGANTFNDLNFSSVSASGLKTVSLAANQTINGALTFGAANTAIRRMRVISDTIGTRRTMTLNGSLATLADVDFRDIGAAGTVGTPWTGTRIGNCLNNNNITFDAPKTVYWNLAGSQNWSATGWATTNTGVPAVNNFPLAQDTATFTEAGAAGTVVFDGNWQVGSIQMADGVSNRTTAFTLTTGSTLPTIYGNLTFFTNLIFAGTGIATFAGQGVTQIITSSGKSFTQPLVANLPGGTIQLSGNLTNTGTTFTLTAGTLDLNNNTLTCNVFSSTNSNTRTIAFGTGNITVTGNNATVWTTSTSTGLTLTGTPVINATYAGSTGTRTFFFGSSTSTTESNVFSLNVTAGSDTVVTGGTSRRLMSLNFTGFSGSYTLSDMIIHGDLTMSSAMTVVGSGFTINFRSTASTQNVTSNGKSIDCDINISVGSTAKVKFVDVFSQSTSKFFTVSGGTIEFASGQTHNLGNLSYSGSSPKFLQSTTPGVQATLSQASGTVNATYTTIQDINATGGATWNAFYVNNNVDAGNNTGWNFTDNPINVSEVTMRLRSFTEPRSF